MRVIKFIIFIVFLLILFIIIFFGINHNMFKVSKIIIKSPITINEKLLLKKYGIFTGNYIFQYNSSHISRSIASEPSIDKVFVHRNYPSTLKIIITLRNPIARIQGKGGKIFFIDKEGNVFSRRETSDSLPLLTVDNEVNINVGVKITGKYFEVLNLLLVMKDKYNMYYNSISAINCDVYGKTGTYTLNFRTINKTITLKNNLNVENSIDAYSIAKIANWENPIDSEFYMIDRAFFYKREGNN